MLDQFMKKSLFRPINPKLNRIKVMQYKKVLEGFFGIGVALRYNSTTKYEKNDKIGGQISSADCTDCKTYLAGQKVAWGRLQVADRRMGGFTIE